jgi:hypothetical protein
LRCSPANTAASSQRDARVGTGAWLNIENGNRRKTRELARDAQRQEPRQKRPNKPRGEPYVVDRPVLNGIFWALRSFQIPFADEQ